MKPGLISVIVPFYNSGEFIKRCVESILAQDYADFELLMIDDGSTDSTRVILCCNQLQIAKSTHLWNSCLLEFSPTVHTDEHSPLAFLPL